MGCINYNCDDTLGNHTLSNCGLERVGGASAILLLECGHQLTDPSNGTQINAEIAANRATLVQMVSVSYDRASPIEVPSSIPCEPDRVVNYTRQLMLKDENVNADNVNFYNDVFKGRRFEGAIIFECGNESNQVKFIDATLTFTGSDRLPNSNSEFQDFEGIAKWKGRTMPAIYAAPTGVLD